MFPEPEAPDSTPQQDPDQTSLSDLGADVNTVLEQRNTRFREEFIEILGHEARQKFGADAIADVVFPCGPHIAVRVLLVPPEGEIVPQKYALCQTFGAGHITSLDLISLPLKKHGEIMKIYAREMLGLPHDCHYITGGRLGFHEDGVVCVFETSVDFGVNLAGFNSNCIAGHILTELEQVTRVDVHQEVENLKTSAEDFFSFWLDRYASAAEEDPQSTMEKFLNAAFELHRRNSSALRDYQPDVEQGIRALNSPDTETDTFFSILMQKKAGR